METAVLEVVLDPGAADPAHSAVADDDLPVVDVPEAAKVPPQGAVLPERPGARAGLRRPDDAHLDAGRRQALVERARAPSGSEPCRSTTSRTEALRRLAHERLGELLAHRAGAEAELVDVDRRRCRGDVLEHAREERPALHESLGVRRAALGEPSARSPRSTGPATRRSACARIAPFETATACTAVERRGPRRPDLTVPARGRPAPSGARASRPRAQAGAAVDGEGVDDHDVDREHRIAQSG